MENKEKIIETLQAIVTGLSQQAIGHQIQSKLFASKGYTKLAKKYAEHFEEEMDYVNKCIDRILDLGGDIKNETKQETPIYTDPIKWIKHDMQISKNGLSQLMTIINDIQGDPSTYDMLKEYYKDEEEDMFWGEAQLELIKEIGVQNWLSHQL